MSDAYTVHWSRDRCERAALAAAAALPLEVLFGGPHLSQPGFRRAGVGVGDLVYPVAVRDGTLFVLGRVRVGEIVHLDPGGDGLARYLHRFRPWRFLAGTCTDEVVLGEHGTRVRLDAAMAPEQLRRLAYRSRRGTRTLRHLDGEGRLTASLGVQGIYRLAEECVADLDAVLALPPGAPRLAGPGRRPRYTPPAGMETLF